MQVVKNIEWSPKNYAEAAVIAEEAADEMLARLSWLTMRPQTILEVGAGTGVLSSKLMMHYPQANLITIDNDSGMIEHVHYFHDVSSICADAYQLPIASHSIDMLCANLVTPWLANFSQVLKEWKRVLRPNAVISFTTFGLDTMKEWDGLFTELPTRSDMHDVGDLLMREGFAEPVLDVNYYNVSYQDKLKLAHELQAIGMLSENEANIIRNNRIQPSEDGKWHVTYEIIHAHAFIPGVGRQKMQNGEIKIPVDKIKKNN